MRQHLKKLRIALQIRKSIMEEALADTGWSWGSPKGGLNLWLKLPDDISVERLLHESIRQSLSFVPGTLCDPAGGMKSWIRLSYSFLNEGRLRDGTSRLVDIASRIRR
jgi:GntR family transcriptional regulator of abcA and norABC